MSAQPQISLRIADDADRERIYAIRHQVYARELGQHAENDEGRLTDALDAVNVYLVATVGRDVAGFVSITPPNDVGYSIDKYFARDDVPLAFDQGLYEVRLLTVTSTLRASRIAAVLMYGAWRYVESRGGRAIVCIGRLEVLDMYQRVGLRSLGRRARSGNVTYELMVGEMGAMRDESIRWQHIADDLERHVDWKVQGVGFRRGGVCYHGGAFFEAIGDEFDELSRKDDVINADVLDAWFDPAPSVLEAVAAHLPWTLKTSPPTGCEGMRRMLARARGVREENILPGAGSSDLIFLGLRHWLRPESRVLILDPMYGEYAHVLERVVGCRVDRLTLARAKNYSVECEQLATALERGYDWVMLVNPNSPTGQHVPRHHLESLLDAAPGTTRFWIDETYVEYAGPAQSLEQFAAASTNVVICKSMSKVYALSGARCAYLCGPAYLMDELRTISPPWAVSLPGQIAACEALRSVSYYRDRWNETHALREELSRDLRTLGWDVLPACANFVLCHLPVSQPEASVVVAECRKRNLFLRDVANMGACFDARTLRVAVKDARTNATMLEILRATLAGLSEERVKAA
jgi:histidinol-phosphate/aromatic aminotransferase/cobyric acid decarboxylase-like protein